ncbi:MAG TPA: hypothetical protein VKV57_13740 [bacterium]|nr:hypothetical protein [bacterium]
MVTKGQGDMYPPHAGMVEEADPEPRTKERTLKADITLAPAVLDGLRRLKTEQEEARRGLGSTY